MALRIDVANFSYLFQSIEIFVRKLKLKVVPHLIRAQETEITRVLKTSSRLLLSLSK